MSHLRSDTGFFRNWIRASLFNLFLVALLGTAMRYKIVFSLPWLPQKNVLHAHSHFAFAGWLSLVLMTLMIRYLSQRLPGFNRKKYNLILWANLSTAVGMLLSFPVQGYGPVSITCSTLSIFVSYAFAVVYWRDLSKIPGQSITKLWFRAALIWLVLSSAGAFSLAYMMATGTQHEYWYLGAIYFYLHFQYNGWFFFACAGLLYKDNAAPTGPERNIFYLLAVACLPAYFLSVLWAPIPDIVYVVTAIAAVMQLLGWLWLVQEIRKRRIVLLKRLRSTVRILLIFALLAGTVKFLLQAGSLHPGLAQIAFGFRPIVIAYLHLALLGLLTIFIIAYLKHSALIPPGGTRKAGLVIFVGGIVLQELLLLLQGLMAVSYNSLPYINEALFAAALVMLLGILLLNAGMMQQRNMETIDQAFNNL